MGCLCSKASAVEDSGEGVTNKLPSSAKWSSEVEVRQNSATRDGGDPGKEKLTGSHVNVSLIENKDYSPTKLHHDHHHSAKKEGQKAILTSLKLDHPSLVRVPKASEGEQVAAGWPSWLSAAAGEAINGWVPRCANTFEKLDKIGHGTYSSVYKAHDLTYQKVVALKKVRFDNLDPESVKFMAREILILRRLQHPNIIKLEGLITSQMSRSLYLVFEYMEHDLTGLAARPGIRFSEPQVKCYMKQLLSGLDYCHRRGVLHRDIKGSNLLIDNNGILKIADFGLATFFDPDHSVPLTSRVVTLWYRPPELLLGASHYGVAVDLWSAGCILGELYAGKPILPGKTEVEQLHKIFKLCGSPSEDYWGEMRLPHAAVFKPPHPYRRCVGETFKEFPAVSVRLIETLISVDPRGRGTAAAALESEFFTTHPLACDPSSLPTYPPSKEIDAKLRGELYRRQRAIGGREDKYGLGTLPGKEASVAPEQPTSIQRTQARFSSTSRSQLLNGHKNETHSGFQEHPCKRPSFSGPLVQGTGWTKTGKQVDTPSMYANTAKLSNLSSLVATKMQSCHDKQDQGGSAQPEKTFPNGRFIDSMGGSQSRRRQDQRRHAYFHHHEDEGVQTKDVSLETIGSRGNKIYVSGPLLFPSNNVDQMLKDHERKIQEFSRRARVDKARGERVQT